MLSCSHHHDTTILQYAVTIVFSDVVIILVQTVIEHDNIVPVLVVKTEGKMRQAFIVMAHVAVSSAGLLLATTSIAKDNVVVNGRHGATRRGCDASFGLGAGMTVSSTPFTTSSTVLLLVLAAVKGRGIKVLGKVHMIVITSSVVVQLSQGRQQVKVT